MGQPPGKRPVRGPRRQYINKNVGCNIKDLGKHGRKGWDKMEREG